MIIVVPDETRKFPLQQVEAVDRTIDDLFADIKAFVQANCPNWTDFSTSDLGTQVLWIQAVLADLMVQTVNQAARNCFLATVTDRYWLRALCSQLGYTVQETTAATVEVTFTLTGGHGGFTIPSNTQIATAPLGDETAVIFETVTDHPVQVGDSTAAVDCIQGETIYNEILGSSDGSADQIFYLRRRPVVWQSEVFQVNEGSGFVTWIRVDHLVDSAADDRHYYLAIDSDGYVYIHTGDGVNGKVPPVGTNNIRITYRKGGGVTGNVGATEITELISAVDNIASLTNILAATGGQDQEAIAEARRNASAQILTGDRIVTADDVKDILSGYRSTTYGEIGPAAATGIDNLTTDVRFLPATGLVPSAGFKTEIEIYLNARRMINTEIEVTDPEFTAVDYDVTIYLEDNYNQAGVVEAVRQAIVKFGSGHYKDANGLFPNEFGEDIKLSQLIAAIMAVAGVQYCTVADPSTDVTVPTTRIRQVQSIDITANQGGVETSYTSMETEL